MTHIHNTGGKLISQEEQFKLIEDYKQNGNIESRNEVISSMTLLVTEILHSDFVCREEVMQDAFQEGVLGIVKAIDDFDKSKGVKFSTYAAFWIKNKIRNCLHFHAGQVGLKDHVANKRRVLKKEIEDFKEKHGRGPNETELCDITSISKKNLHFYIGESGGEISFNDDDNAEVLHQEYLVSSDEGMGNPLKNLVKKESAELLAKALLSLTDDEKTVIESRFNSDNENKSLKEVGRDMGCSYEWVRMLEEAAINKIKRAVQEPQFRMSKNLKKELTKYQKEIKVGDGQ